MCFCRLKVWGWCETKKQIGSKVRLEQHLINLLLPPNLLIFFYPMFICVLFPIFWNKTPLAPDFHPEVTHHGWKDVKIQEPILPHPLHLHFISVFFCCSYEKCEPMLWSVFNRLIIWHGKHFSIALFSDTENVINLKLCMIGLPVELYLGVLLSVTFTMFQSHRSVK